MFFFIVVAFIAFIRAAGEGQYRGKREGRTRSESEGLGRHAPHWAVPELALGCSSILDRNVYYKKKNMCWVDKIKMDE